jgi:anti-sigma B factor antagonist
MLSININTVGQVIVVELSGEIDGKTAPEAQQQILAVIQPAAKILLDLSRVGFMSSAGLRALLATYRQVTKQKAIIRLVGLSEELEDTMSATGFLSFFSIDATLEAGLAALES